MAGKKNKKTEIEELEDMENETGDERAANRMDICERLMSRGYTRRASMVVIEDIFDVITELLADGRDVTLREFGTFHRHMLAARKGVDMFTKEEIVIPEHVIIKFKPSKALRHIMTGGTIKIEKKSGDSVAEGIEG